MGKLKWPEPLRPLLLVLVGCAECVRPADHFHPASATHGEVANLSRLDEPQPGTTLDDPLDQYHYVEGVTPAAGRWVSQHEQRAASSNATSATLQTGSANSGFEGRDNITSGEGPERLDVWKARSREAPLRSANGASLFSERELEERQRLLKEIPRLLQEQAALEKRLHEDEIELTQLNGYSSSASHANGSDSHADRVKDPAAPFVIVDDEQDRIYDHVKAASIRLESRIAEENKKKMKIDSQLAVDKTRLESLEKRLEKNKADEAGTKAAIDKLRGATDSARSSISETIIKSMEAGKEAGQAATGASDN